MLLLILVDLMITLSEYFLTGKVIIAVEKGVQVNTRPFRMPLPVSIHGPYAKKAMAMHILMTNDSPLL